jgi:3-keto-5-aminohexanoate cleavage enzyme
MLADDHSKDGVGGDDLAGSHRSAQPAHVAHPLRPYPPLIINVALTGMVPRRERVPHVPVTAAQIIEDAQACFRTGASIVHLHARTADESPEWKREAYEAFIPEIRRLCPGIVVCVTTSGRTFGKLEQRSDVLLLEGEAKPDMASLTLGSLNFRDVASVNAPQMIRALAERMAENGIRPELEIFDSGMAYLAKSLLAEGLLPEPVYANILLGSPNTAPATVGDLAHLVDALPTDAVWAAAGIGAFQLPMNAIAVFAGGHVRTGLEDNPHLDRDTRTPGANAELVGRVAHLAEIAGRSVSTVAQTRALLGLTVQAVTPVDG